VKSEEVVRPLVLGSDPEALRGPSAEEIRKLLGVKDTNAEQATERAVELLARRITASVNAKTQVVRVAVSLPSAEASVAVHQRLIASLAEVNQRARQVQASAERRFSTARLKEVEAELRSAEAALRAFAERNRVSEASPSLSIERGRLERDVSFRQQVFVSLAQAVEQARIEEVRDTPLLSILQLPRRPVFPDSRGTIGRMLLGIIAGSAAAMFALLLRHALSNESPQVDARAVLRDELSRFWAPRTG
jgi:uncharacterized protein involved in exopolysaccharide biosynthesis